MLRRHILIPVAALMVTLPLLVNGCSCGHDFGFHMQSWLEAASQFRHGTWNLHWAFSPAFNAGEPRFLFYPPLSWMLGGLLTLVLPVSLVPAVYTFLVLTAAGFSMYRLASHFVAADAALFASAFYVANPYMLFNAFERTAYAELLASVWLPLLFLAALRERPTIVQVALPVALLWLTNAPAAVMGCYGLVVIVAVRLLWQTRSRSGTETPSALALTTTMTAGASLGLGIAAFYLIPAAYERRFVQIAMAIIPNMRFQDNFLFGQTGDGPHDHVLHTVSVLAVSLLIATTLAVSLMLARSLRMRGSPLISSTLLVLTACIALLLTPLSTPLWNHIPELAFLQFPWRLLSVLAVVLAFAVAAVMPRVKTRAIVLVPLTLTLVAALTLPAFRGYGQACEAGEHPEAMARALTTHHGVAATDEYTPANADNDVLRSNDPAYWLADSPAEFAPGTLPNPAATVLNYDKPPAPNETISGRPAEHFSIHADHAGYLILNLRDYPNWDVAVADANSRNTLHPAHIARDDGLLALPLSNGGDYNVDIAWRRSLDQQLGLAVSALACAAFGALSFRAWSRRIEG